jgi:putative mRNA 3-end processing factor
MPDKLLEFTSYGIFCKAGGFYIDPWKPVKNAIITHGHSDHARWGNENYLCHSHALHILKARLGEDTNVQTINYNEDIYMNGVKVSFHPAGHIVGSAMIRVEHKGEVWLASGDYKTEEDGISTPLEAVKCHHFISETTFGLPIYKWLPQEKIFEGINKWWLTNRRQKVASVIFAYSLGKAQRILCNVDKNIGNIYLHGAVANMNQAIEKAGIKLPFAEKITAETDKNLFPGSLIIAPPSAMSTPWMNKFRPYSTAIASGWMTLRGARRRKAADRGFILSDHADWDGLLSTIEATGAENIYLTHGYTAAFARFLADLGLNAQEVPTRFTGEED